MKPIPELTESDLKRFWSKVDKRGSDDCWEWMAGSTSRGYGVFDIGKSKYYAHRVSYAITNDELGELCVCHTCDNPGCVNFDHLWLGTHQENVIDKVEKDRQHKGEVTPWSILTEEQVTQIRISNEPDSILAIKFGVARTTISSVRILKSWKHIPGKKYTRQRKLSLEQVSVIKMSSDRSCDLAKRFNVSPQLICDIKKGRRYVT